ncbi:50S ribosomal protein L3 N(5)-glutamine methyltransferase [Solimonas marina]|uniref:50S ribosomal protein L3 N(5)-glutamine methyltransferase n=1 Tax=Solimonas marina TaxID=2714601 RepID=A0A970B6K6_9GAMM|nr:50S ribosomal protein L3 N(5)-glutamine methyltransferase [Solimonas marina]NKF22700.1 50S ribosomal protein L3 N(5)-glutamine methyltransferase [Solimonas marina]
MSRAAETDVLTSVRDLVRWGASRFREAGLTFGHGTDNALDEAFHLVLHALHLPADVPAIYLESTVTARERTAALKLLRTRITTRKPAAYLLGHIEFCGLDFEVNESVLIPRSPIGELIARGFMPWLQQPPARVLDLCTGSGCIGIACAALFDEAEVDLADLSPKALAVARRNIEKHVLGNRVRAIRSDVFDGLTNEVYDLIVTNPPYVPNAEWKALSAEYRHEPKMALAAGSDGMDIVARILDEAPRHLSNDGWLVCEVGGSVPEFEARWPDLPVTWVDFVEENGGEGAGVFIISRADLLAHR